MSEVKANKISPATSTVVTLGDSSDTFVVTTGAKIDINGTELILDADADTSITADTDDQIDIKIAGADDFSFKANKFEVQTGSNIDMNGTELILDADADTSITADTDDQIDIKIAGADDFRFTANNFNILSGSTLTVDSGATVTNSGTATGFGKCIQVVHGFVDPSDNANMVTISNTAGGQSAEYNVYQGARVYGLLQTVNITPTNSSNLLLIWAQIGYDSLNNGSNKGGFGVIIEHSGTGYPFGNYPWYAAASTLGASGYPPDDTYHKTLVAGTTSQIAMALRGFSYNESSPSAANVVRVRGSHLTIMEVAV